MVYLICGGCYSAKTSGLTMIFWTGMHWFPQGYCKSFRNPAADFLMSTESIHIQVTSKTHLKFDMKKMKYHEFNPLNIFQFQLNIPLISMAVPKIPLIPHIPHIGLSPWNNSPQPLRNLIPKSSQLDHDLVVVNLPIFRQIPEFLLLKTFPTVATVGYIQLVKMPMNIPWNPVNLS